MLKKDSLKLVSSLSQPTVEQAGYLFVMHCGKCFIGLRIDCFTISINRWKLYRVRRKQNMTSSARLLSYQNSLKRFQGKSPLFQWQYVWLFQELCTFHTSFFLHLGGRYCKLFSQTRVEEIDETRFKTACLKLLVVLCIVDVSLTLQHTSTSCESDSRCPMRWWRRYSGSRLVETRNRQGSWEVTLYTLLPRVLHWF